MVRTTLLIRLLPAAIAAGALTWLVPVTSPAIERYSLVVIPLTLSWTFLTIWLASAVINGLLAQRLLSRRRGPGTTWTVLQLLLLAVLVVGSIPTVCFDLDPGLLESPLAIVSGQVLPWVVIAGAIAQCVVLLRRTP